jgi:hypothetical protein
MLLSPADWQSILHRASLPQFQPALQRLRHEAAAFMAQPLSVQTKPGGYYHDYFCPEHGTPLLFDPTSPTEHRCPLDNALWQGERFDAAWRWFVNNQLSEAAIRLALCWRLDGNTAYLQQVTQILHEYADHYASYQQVPRTVRNPGVATYTTLDESVWILPLVWAFDMIQQYLLPEEIDHINQHLFTPVAEHLITHHFSDVHNFACWHNAAIGTLAVLLDRADWLNFAIHADFGFDDQLAAGVLADGFWFEGSFSYHFYALAALIALAKATRHLPAVDLRNRAALRAMFLAPIQAAYPDWSLPATNDCWYFSSLLADCCHGVPPAPAFYEVAHSWYHDPLFAEVLHGAYRQSPRDSLDALLFGEPSLPPASFTSMPSVNMPASGYAILRDTVPEANPIADNDSHQRYLLLKYGPHGGGHGHPDKLNLILYAYGQRLSPDLGTPGYGLDLFESWYRQTISHNTVTINGLSQPPATGHINTFRSNGAFQIADASVSWSGNGVELPFEHPYHDISMRRILLARPDYFLDIVLVEDGEAKEGREAKRIDWIYHNIGTPIINLPGQADLITSEEGTGYQHISHAQAAPVQGDFVVHWPPVATQPQPVGLQLFVAGGIPGEAITGKAPGNPPTDPLGVLIHRRQAATTAYLSLFHPYQATPKVTRVEWLGHNLLKEGWAGCLVHCDGCQEQWLVRMNPGSRVPPLPSTPQVAAHFEYNLSQP